MTDNEKLIEEAKAGLAAFDEYWGDGGPVDAAYGRPWELIRSMLSVFEKAHTPTDDEREALAIVKGAKEAYLEAYPGDDHSKRFAALDRLAAGFRRSEVPEPSTGGYECCDVPGGPERCGDCPLDRGPKPQGEPSDAQEAVRRLKDSGVGAYMILAAVTKVYDMETKP